MKNLIKIILGLATAITLAACADDDNGKDKGKTKKFTGSESIETKVIYGEDNRRDLYNVTDSMLLKLADSTVALVSSRELTASGDRYLLDTTTFGQSYGLCQSEPFREQNNVAFCSGSLVGPRLVLTAGHCIRSSSNCADTRFVFGYAVKAYGAIPTTVPKSEVYSCARIVHTLVKNNGKDFAVIELDRDVVGHQPLKVRRSGTVAVGDELVVIGHPSGLPTKIADGATVRSIQSEHFVANLDTFGGNSGSAVFNRTTGVVEGILVRGETDFKMQGSCNVSYRCTDTGCRGEDVTKVTEAVDYIPELVDSTQEPPVHVRKVYSSNTVISIPDNSATGISSSVVTDEIPRGRKVYVEVNITHTWRGDLVVSLVSPDGVEHMLSNRVGRSTQNIVGTFGKDLPADLTAAAQVTRAGIWTLKVSDRALRDIGRLNSWSLIFE